MHGRRRLSETISEGEGISLLAAVAGVGDVAAAEASGAEGVVAPPGIEAAVVASTELPVLARAESPEAAGAAGADGWLLVAEEHEGALAERYAATVAAGLECVVDVRDDEELEGVLATIDAEIVLLSPRGAEHGEPEVDRVLELLPDVPAGMLVVAELLASTEEDVLALERAGVDAVLVGVEALAALGATRPAG